MMAKVGKMGKKEAFGEAYNKWIYMLCYQIF
jgi:hypothetical protein